MSDYLIDLFDESSELAVKIWKLERFIIGDTYDTLPDVDRLDLKKQLIFMQGYYKVLGDRISRECNAS